MNVIFPVYKPKGMTSHDVVARIRRVTGERRVGHAGTLDPLAEGVLVIGVGREATRSLENEVKKEKEYMAEIMLGIVSTTDDEEGKKTNTQEHMPVPSVSRVEEVLHMFVGTIEQVPPQFSAIKVQGKRAYKLAREGKEAMLKPRHAYIASIDLLSYAWPHLSIRVVTGPGVYIRSLARDIGHHLGVGAYLSGLVRTRVGTMKIERAIPLDTVAEHVKRHAG